MLAERPTSTEVLVLSNRTGAGLLFNGSVEVVLGDEPLAIAVLRALRERGVAVRDGDMLFFPDASPGHRAVQVTGHDGIVRRHEWAG
jgi:hypothetical protein